jgi:hypothetical protein
MKGSTSERTLRWRGAWTAIVTRHPALGWLWHWGISAVSLVSGTLTLLVFRRGLEYVPWFIGYLLLAWLAGVAMAGRRRLLAERGHHGTARLVAYTVQSLLHGLLLFLLPIYYASTTLASRNSWLLLLLAGAAVLTTIDPWYRGATCRLPWLESTLFALALFASLSVALPLVRVPTGWALPLSGILSVLAIGPAAMRAAGPLRRKALVALVVGSVALAFLLTATRAWFPPVPLHVSRLAFAMAVVDLEPLVSLSEISSAEASANGGILAYSAVVAPAGLRDGIQHVWRKDGRVVGRVQLPVRGGRPAGFRTFSRKADLGPNPAGQWSVEVLTLHGQLLGRITLTVTPDPPPPPAPAPPAPTP